MVSAKGITTPIVGLYRYCGRWQLSAATAIYSDGAAYRPLVSAFSFLSKEISSKKNMLVLGAGLGSAVSILHRQRIKMDTTLVDIDPQIIQWGKQIIEAETKYPCTWILDDVAEYVKKCKESFDIIVIDIFQDRIVPAFITSKAFLDSCHQILSNNKGVIVMNYIVCNEALWQEDFNSISSVFRVEKTISIGINKVIILRKNA